MVNRRKPTSSQKKSAAGRVRTTKPSTGVVRIIGGLWRGRKLPVQDAEGLRPTTDRVKETVFNWLAMDVPKGRCLDLFAGAGSLGFEAASRQADHVTMIELNPSVFKQLQQNCTTLKAQNIDLIHGDALSFLAQTASAPFDVVFIDPPFRKGLLEEACNKLEENGWLNKQAMIYLEAEKECEIDDLPSNWVLHREKTAGQVCYRLFVRK